MESIILSSDHLFILGDLNIHMDISTDADTVKFVDLLESLGLEQHVSVKRTDVKRHQISVVKRWKGVD